MGQITARTRLVFGQTCLLVSILLVAIALQLVPERKQAVIDGRATLCENIAVSSSHLVAKNELRMVGSVLQAIVDRNPDVLSVAVRRTRGQLLIEAGDHEENWNPVAHGRSDESNVFVPVYAGAQPWGSVEACFATLRQTGFMGVFNHRWARFVVFVSAATYLAYSAYLAKMLAQPVPSRAVPQHVRETLNTFAEELIMIDTRDRILFTNESFSGLIGTSSRAVTGRRIGLLD